MQSHYKIVMAAFGVWKGPARRWRSSTGFSWTENARADPLFLDLNCQEVEAKLETEEGFDVPEEVPRLAADMLAHADSMNAR